ncbi:putative UPF0481 protein [Platanthera guangdongensis]|uniref:UPF0481 protein n=1 Tax=Platanthera guangdongensis TaxID=2320717 RepID=A0ABR2LTA3_9ASPA
MASPENRGYHPDEWVVQIRQSLQEGIGHGADDGEDDCENIPVSIASIPKFLRSSDPEAYAPHVVAIGPYHHFRADLQDMAGFKLCAAKRIRRELRGVEFQRIVDEFVRAEEKIRSHYHRHINLNSDTLAWMMAVDACFLLQFLRVYACEAALKGSSPPFMSRTKISHNSVLRDILMLENQIPLFLLRKILDFSLSSTEEADEHLSEMLKNFTVEISPFKLPEEHLQHCFHPQKSSHLVEILYSSLVPEAKQLPEIDEIEEENDENSLKDQAFDVLNHVKQAIISWLCKLLLKLSFKILSSLPGFLILRESFEYFSQSENPVTERDVKKAPFYVEEIAIPSATELVDAGIRFSPTNGLSAIMFDMKDGILQLPAIRIDANTEVILRNLVAYETVVVSGPPVIAGYSDFMNGIVDTAEDAKVLRRRGVILNRLKSDADVADLWNGMRRSCRLPKVQFFDKVIEDVNVYYNRSWSVKAKRLARRYVFGSWQLLVFVVAFLLLLLLSLQAFCLVFGCARRINVRREDIKG